MFGRTTYALIYVREDCTTCEDIWKAAKVSQSRSLRPSDKERVGGVWCGDAGDDRVDNHIVSRNDILTAAGTSWLNDEVINTFLNQISSEVKHIRDTTTSTTFMTNLQDGIESIENHMILNDSNWLKENDIILVPIHLQVGVTTTGQWQVYSLT